VSAMPCGCDPEADHTCEEHARLKGRCEAGHFTRQRWCQDCMRLQTQRAREAKDDHGHEDS
jgi:ssDNA-binding Zn-finger/Zn-ribbon topoisomerase 1